MKSSWKTREGDAVGVGDLVAVSVLGHRGAKGRIVGPMDADSVEVMLTGCETCSGGVPVRVYEDGLVWLLAQKNGDAREGTRGGEPQSARLL